jgi:hypothetical protein
MNPAVSNLPPEGGYPIQMGVTTERTMNRWWGIPFIGMMVRAFLCIPHFVVQNILQAIIWIWTVFLGWIPILLNGRVPALFLQIATEYLQRTSRVLGYVFFMMPSEYPPLEPGPSKPINVQVMPQTLEINRLWGIPLFGLFVRFLCLIPHVIIASILWTLTVLAWLFVWIPVLLFGRYPDWAASFFGLTLRYTLRLAGWMMFLPVPYPPILPD